MINLYSGLFMFYRLAVGNTLNSTKYRICYKNTGITAGFLTIYDNTEWKIESVTGKVIKRDKDSLIEEIFRKSDWELAKYLDQVKIIWFNGEWFSSIASVMNGIKSEFGDKIELLGSSHTKQTTYRNVVDSFILEPGYQSTVESYVDFALNVCKLHYVDVFIPKRNVAAIAREAGKFRKLGTTVICEDPKIYTSIKSKKSVYERIVNSMPELVPSYEVITSYSEFEKAYNRIKGVSLNGKVVIKYDIDEGASSFRVIDNSAFGYGNLSRKHENILSEQEAFNIIQDADNVGKLKPLIVMEFMDDPEISVDCYKTGVGVLETLVRVKKSSRMKEILSSGELYDKIVDYCARIQKMFGLKQIFNVQFRWVNGELKLLEINARMSGGMHLGQPLKINIPNRLIGETLGLNVKPSECRHSIVSQYEYPILVDK